MTGLTSLPIAASGAACHRVLTAVRQYRREHGCSPSFGEIERRTRVKRRNIARTLRRLERDGLVAYRPGAADAIMLVDRAGNLSDEELVAAVAGRGGRVVWVPVPVPALVTTFEPDPRLPPGQAELLARLS